MSIITQSVVKFTSSDGREYSGRAKIGFTLTVEFGIRIHPFSDPEKDPTSWSYTTYLGISSKEFRRGYPTNTSVQDFGSYLKLKDDVGYCYQIEADREVIEHLLQECEENEVPLIKE